MAQEIPSENGAGDEGRTRDLGKATGSNSFRIRFERVAWLDDLGDAAHPTTFGVPV